MRTLILLAAILCLTARMAFAQVDVPPPPAPGGDAAATQAEQEGIETLTRGPIHEAFANPAEADPQASAIVTEKPPADVPEQPPAYQPEGNFLWLPGYWDWDDERRGYLWVTGVWRQPPPDKRWLPGYWNEVDGGWQRVKGFWVNDEIENVTYYDAPPASLETGPSSPAPADNYFWTPGSWTTASATTISATSGNSGFAWQGGYWAPYQPNWVWIPARWAWTPAGYVFLPGFWDYRLADRGQIFAPVYFRTALYSQPGWFYQPTVVIPTNNLFIHLWIRPQVGSYYFGNYFGPQYAGLGYVGWANLASYQPNRYYYDPFYSYARVHYRQQGVDYLGRVQGWHNYYAEHPEHRPPSNWHEQQQWLASRPAGSPTASTQFAAHNIIDASRQAHSPLKITKLDERALASQKQHVKQLHDLDVTRRNIEREHALTSAKLLPGDNALRNREAAKAGSLVDRAEKGKALGEATSHNSNPLKLALPKVDQPKAISTVTRTPGGTPQNSVLRVTAPPLPTAGREAVTTQGKVPGNLHRLPTNVLPDTAGAGQRSTFSQKTSDPLSRGQIPDRNNELPHFNQQGKSAGGGVPRSNTLLPDGGDASPGPARGQQPTIRNFTPPQGESKGEGARGPARSGGRENNGGNNSPPSGSKGKNRPTDRDKN